MSRSLSDVFRKSAAVSAVVLTVGTSFSPASAAPRGNTPTPQPSGENTSRQVPVQGFSMQVTNASGVMELSSGVYLAPSGTAHVRVAMPSGARADMVKVQVVGADQKVQDVKLASTGALSLEGNVPVVGVSRVLLKVSPQGKEQEVSSVALVNDTSHPGVPRAAFSTEPTLMNGKKTAVVPSGSSVDVSHLVDDFSGVAHVALQRRVGDKWQDTDSQDFDAAAIASSRDKQVSRDGKVTLRATGGLSASLRLGDSGEYRVAVTDASGRVGVWSLSDIGAVSDVQVRDYAPSNIGFSTDNKTWQAQGATGWMKFDDAPLLHVAVHNEGSFVARNEVTVNGVPVVSDDIGFDAKRSAQSGYEVNIHDLVATKKVPPSDSGVYRVQVVSHGLFGRSQNASYDVRLDSSAPYISGASVTGAQAFDGGTLFAHDDTGLSVSVQEHQSGIAAVDLLYTDSSGAQKVQKLSESGSGAFVGAFPDGSAFRVRVRDNAGFETVKPLTELGVPAFEAVVHDSAAPKVSLVSAPKTLFSNDAGAWVADKRAGVTFRVSDEHFSSVAVQLNGRTLEQSQYTVSPVQGSRDVLVHVPGSSLPSEGAVQLQVTAWDKSKNSAKEGTAFNVDAAAPSQVRASLRQREDITVHPWGIYTRNSQGFVVDFAASDSGSGVKTFEVLDASGRSLTSIEARGSSAAVQLPPGAYAVRVYDAVGNRTVDIKLSELLGVPDSAMRSFVVDTEAPRVDVSVPDAKFTDSSGRVWFDGDVPVRVNVHDNTSVAHAQVRVNGQVVKEFTADRAVSDVPFEVSTKGIAPNADGSYVVEVTADDAAGNRGANQRQVFVDAAAPQVVSMTAVNASAQLSSAAGQWGAFFAGSSGAVQVKVADTAPSSGVRAVRYSLRDATGAVKGTGEVPVSGDNAMIDVPADFKGFITAYAVDNVGKTSDGYDSTGLLVQTRGMFASAARAEVKLPDTDHKDAAGVPLYNADTQASVSLSQPFAGIKHVAYGVGDTTLGEGSVQDLVARGVLSVDAQDRNLVTGAHFGIPVMVNVNNARVWVRAVDNVGYEFEDSKQVSVDKDAPQVNVAYDGEVAEGGFYNSNRTATVTVKERNFSAAGVKLSGTYDTVSDWVQVAPDTWVAKVSFTQDRAYQFGMQVTDLAGNVSQNYQSPSFTIDKVAPALDVQFSDNSPSNTNKYRTNRTARVVVRDVNFDPATGVKFESVAGGAQIGAFSRQGDAWVADVTFASEGERHFAVQVKDKANNSSQRFDSGVFVVDTKAPEVKVDGIAPGVSYKRDLGFKVEVADREFDAEKSSVVLHSRKHGDVPVDGSFVKSADSSTFSRGTWTFKNPPREQKWDDVYTLKVKMVDSAGNEETREIPFSINRFGSDFVFENEDYQGKFYRELPADIVLNQTSVDRMRKDGFQVIAFRDNKRLNPEDVHFEVEESGGKDSDWNYKVRINKDSFKQDGTYRIQLVSTAEDGTRESSATQKAQEGSSVAQEYAFGIDATPPQVLVSGIDSNGAYNDVERHVTVDVRDLSGVADFKAQVQKGDKVEDVKFSRGEDGKYTLLLPADSSPQDVSFTVRDAAGNVSVEKVSNVLISTNAFAVASHHGFWRYVGLGLLAGGSGGLLYWWRKKRREKTDEQAEPELGVLDQIQAQGATTGTLGTVYALSGTGDGTASNERVQVTPVDMVPVDVPEVDSAVSDAQLVQDAQVVGSSGDDSTVPASGASEDDSTVPAGDDTAPAVDDSTVPASYEDDSNN